MILEYRTKAGKQICKITGYFAIQLVIFFNKSPFIENKQMSFKDKGSFKAYMVTEFFSLTLGDIEFIFEPGEYFKVLN